jgi:hypothetical protein
MKMNSREKKRNAIKDKQEKTIKITNWIKQTATQQEEQHEKYLINFTVIRNLLQKCFPKQIDSSLQEDTGIYVL